MLNLLAAIIIHISDMFLYNSSCPTNLTRLFMLIFMVPTNTFNKKHNHTSHFNTEEKGNNRHP